MEQQKQLSAKIFLCFLLTTFLFDISQGQTSENIKLLKQKIQSADSVVIISHEVTAEYGFTPELPDWDKKDTSMNLKKWYELHPPQPPYLKFLEQGKINRKIIIESKTLTSDDQVNLSNILLRQVLIQKINRTTCDEPRHTIIIWKTNIQSYIDICFGCRRIHTSKDINFSESYLDDKKWNDLESFFKTNGLAKLFDNKEK
jgi:hypothetical protein